MPTWPPSNSKHASQLCRPSFFLFRAETEDLLSSPGASRGLAEDLAQETLLVVWRKAALFDPRKAGASTWIFTIARNLRLDVARQERLRNSNGVEPSSPPEDQSPSAEETFISSEQEDRLRRALHALRPEQTRLLMLWGFEDKSHGQIERELGIPIGTVKSRLRRALAQLRASLEGCRGN
jgi:RNA polymerase sigma-70 factor, ECF subfamily